MIRGFGTLSPSMPKFCTPTLNAWSSPFSFPPSPSPSSPPPLVIYILTNSLQQLASFTFSSHQIFINLLLCNTNPI